MCVILSCFSVTHSEWFSKTRFTSSLLIPSIDNLKWSQCWILPTIRLSIWLQHLWANLQPRVPCLAATAADMLGLKPTTLIDKIWFNRWPYAVKGCRAGTGHQLFRLWLSFHCFLTIKMQSFPQTGRKSCYQWYAQQWSTSLKGNYNQLNKHFNSKFSLIITTSRLFSTSVL